MTQQATPAVRDDDPMSVFERMRQWADAASGHPTWSVAYAKDVPLLLDHIARLEKFVIAVGAQADAGDLTAASVLLAFRDLVLGGG